MTVDLPPVIPVTEQAERAIVVQMRACFRVGGGWKSPGRLSVRLGGSWGTQLAGFGLSGSFLAPAVLVAL